MDKLREDYLLDEDMKILQNPRHFCFNTDTRLLAQFMRIKPGEHVLDIGTNNGALLKAADRYRPGELIGVEILPEAAEVAMENARHFEHPVKIVQEDIRLFVHPCVDVILANPPYFPESTSHPQTKMTMRQLGRIEKNLTLPQLVYNASRLLKTNGRFYFVHRPNRLFEIMKVLQEYNFCLRRMAIAYDHRDNAPKSLLIEAVKGVQCDTILEDIWWI